MGCIGVPNGLNTCMLKLVCDRRGCLQEREEKERLDAIKAKEDMARLEAEMKEREAREKEEARIVSPGLCPIVQPRSLTCVLSCCASCVGRRSWLVSRPSRSACGRRLSGTQLPLPSRMTRMNFDRSLLRLNVSVFAHACLT